MRRPAARCMADGLEHALLELDRADQPVCDTVGVDRLAAAVRGLVASQGSNSDSGMTPISSRAIG